MEVDRTTLSKGESVKEYPRGNRFKASLRIKTENFDLEMEPWPWNKHEGPASKTLNLVAITN